MGEAKKREERFRKWINRLDREEAVIAQVAYDTYYKFVRPTRLVGGCYLISFFLSAFLRRERGIGTDVVVGWINDGTGPTMTSHAWIEYHGKKTDLTLTLTEDPEIQIPGPLMILDETFMAGKAAYTYHLERSSEALAALMRMRQELPAGYAAAIAAKEEEHLQMRARSQNSVLVDAYLNKAPTDRSYVAIANAVSG